MQVTLKTLRPTQPTDLVELSTALRAAKPKLGALPAALPEPMLLSVARDLREFERSQKVSDVDDNASGMIAAPMMLVLSLMVGPPRPGHDGIQIRESDLYASLQVYQWAVEREIISRITGIAGDDDESTLLETLQGVRKH